MTQFLAKFIVLALLFVSAEAAVCSSLHLINNDEEVVDLHDTDGHSDIHEEYSCSHICHCAHHFATLFNGTALISQKNDQGVYHSADHYYSTSSPPLFRPPIL